MKKYPIVVAILGSIASLSLADTNALIEVELFKTWVLKDEVSFCNLAIKNTGTEPIRLAKRAFDFEIGQLVTRLLPRNLPEEARQEKEYKVMLINGAELFYLSPEETHVYEGRKFPLEIPPPSSEKIHFTVSVYLGNGFWLDSKPLTFQVVVPDAEEHVGVITNVNGSRDLVAVTYKNERWLYTKLGRYYFSVCPLSLTNKIRVEPHDGKSLHKIWDGEKSMIYLLGQSTLTEGPDENDVFGKWTRERKQRAEADNAEVRRKKAEVQAQ